jgi:hypothetical protein
MLSFEQLTVLTAIVGLEGLDEETKALLKYGYGEYASSSLEDQKEFLVDGLEMCKPAYEILKDLYGDTEEV